MLRVSYHRDVDHANRQQCSADRSEFQSVFRGLLGNDLRRLSAGARVLDIGCGAKLPEALGELEPLMCQWDGVDPSDEILDHPNLVSRFHSTLEAAPIEPSTYDAAFAYNVVEHVATPDTFLAKTFELLVPGGVFWALTPHANHPFCMLSRTVEKIGFKRTAADHLAAAEGRRIVNDYPAFYRLNRSSAIRRYAARARFSEVSFYYLPCRQWDHYFPVGMRLLPHLYDALFGTRFRHLMLLLAFKLTK